MVKYVYSAENLHWKDDEYSYGGNYEDSESWESRKSRLGSLPRNKGQRFWDSVDYKDAMDNLNYVLSMLKRKKILGFEKLHATKRYITLEYDIDFCYRRPSPELTAKVRAYLEDQLHVIQSLPCVYSRGTYASDLGSNTSTCEIVVQPELTDDDSLNCIQPTVPKPVEPKNYTEAAGYYIVWGSKFWGPNPQKIGLHFSNDKEVLIEVLTHYVNLKNKERWLQVFETTNPTMDEMIEFLDSLPWYHPVSGNSAIIGQIFERTTSGEKRIIYDRPDVDYTIDDM